MTSRPGRSSESGFTLVELLVTAAVLGFVLTAVLGIYQVTQRSSYFATAGEDAQASARAALARMVTELQTMNVGLQGQTGAITAASATSITFVGLNLVVADVALTSAVDSGATAITVGNTSAFAVNKRFSIAPFLEWKTTGGVAGSTVTFDTGLATSYPAGSVVRTIEPITYTYTPAGDAGTLWRSVGGVADPDPLLANLAAFRMTFWDGSVPAVQTANPDLIREIRIQLTTVSVAGDQTMRRTMMATVRPRNLSKVPGSSTGGI